MKKLLTGLILLFAMSAQSAEVCRLVIENSYKHNEAEIACSDENEHGRTQKINASKKLKDLLEKGYRIDSTVQSTNMPFVYTLIKDD